MLNLVVQIVTTRSYSVNISRLSVSELFRRQQYKAGIQICNKRYSLCCFNATDSYWSERALTALHGVCSTQDKTQPFRLTIKQNISITQRKYTNINANKSVAWRSGRFIPKFQLHRRQDRPQSRSVHGGQDYVFACDVNRTWSRSRSAGRVGYIMTYCYFTSLDVQP